MGRRSSPCGVRRGARLSAVLSRKIGEGNSRSVTWPRKHVGRDARVVAKSCTARARSCSRTSNLHALCGILLFARHVLPAELWTPCETSALARAAVLGHSLCFPLSSLACSALEFQPRNGCAFRLGHDGRQERVCCLLLVVVFLGTVPLS